MGHKAMLAAGTAAAAVAALTLACGLAAGAEPAKSDKKAQGAPATAAEAAAEAKKKDAAAALKAYDAGAKAFEGGKYEPAIQQLSTALSSGGLQSQQMAKALYYRGVAYRKQGKPAQAISDLTTSVWLKNGLSDSERAQAIEQRQGAYREAGLGDTAPPVVAQKVEPNATPAAAATATPAASTAPSSPAVAVSNVGQSGGMFSWFNFGGSSAPPPAAPAAAASVPAPAAAPQAAVSSWSTVDSNAPSATVTPPPAADAPAAATPVRAHSAAADSDPQAIKPEAVFAPNEAPAKAAPPVALNAVPAEAAPTSEPAPAVTGGAAGGPATLADAGKAVTGFFGNLFSGGSSGAQATQTSSSPVLTSSTGSASPAPTSDWGQATTVAAGKTAAASAPAAAAPAAAAMTQPKGKYRLQVAAVRSRDEAGQVVSRLVQQHGSSLGPRQPVIDEAVIGNMGTFYRVRVGPYANAQEPGQLCAALRPQGFDCLVVTQ